MLYYKDFENDLHKDNQFMIVMYLLHILLSSIQCLLVLNPHYSAGEAFFNVVYFATSGACIVLVALLILAVARSKHRITVYRTRLLLMMIVWLVAVILVDLVLAAQTETLLTTGYAIVIAKAMLIAVYVRRYLRLKHLEGMIDREIQAHTDCGVPPGRGTHEK